MSKTICLDAGHGLNTPGKRTPTGIHEWELNNKVRNYVVEYLNGYDVNIIHSDGNEGKTDESLASRLNYYMSRNVDVFVSIHHNANTGTWNNATGVEVFTDKNYTSADMKLAESIYKNLPSYTGLKGRGIKKENWYVINQNKIPAVLVEGGFMDSNIDYKVITSESGQRGYAKAVAEGLISFLDLKKKNSFSGVIKYQAHQQNYGWLPTVTTSDNDFAGITGKALRMEALKIWGEGINLKYRAHVQNDGWQNWVTSGQLAGTEGRSLRMEAIEINADIPIKYRVHVQNKGWMPWVTNGQTAGTTGQSLRIEAIEIKLA